MLDRNVKKPPRVRIKKAKGHGGHHGGAWKVAYADFVTAMMALFLVLWLVSQGDHKLKESIANYFRSPGAFTTTEGGIFDGAMNSSTDLSTSLSTQDDRQALYSTAALLRKKFSKLAESDQVKVDITREGLHIQILDKAERVSFQSGSAELTPAAKEILDEIAITICELPNKIQLGGHTDSYTFPDQAYTNWELSAERANAARRELVARCVKPERIGRIIGYADTQPLVPDNPFSPANRRISIMLLWAKDPQEEKKLTEKDEQSVPADSSKETDEELNEEASKKEISRTH
ncbi:MAG: flagellar motor protein MotB [Acidobacteriota bacterium]